MLTNECIERERERERRNPYLVFVRKKVSKVLFHSPNKRVLIDKNSCQLTDQIL